jgi:glycosyltransferase involved in cell wall biosynthesis
MRRYAYNQAIRQSVGEFLCFFDADDVSCPDRVEKQLALARDPTRHHRSALCACVSQLFGVRMAIHATSAK